MRDLVAKCCRALVIAKQKRRLENHLLANGYSRRLAQLAAAQAFSQPG